jgi:hypothetical protein
MSKRAGAGTVPPFQWPRQTIEAHPDPSSSSPARPPPAPLAADTQALAAARARAAAAAQTLARTPSPAAVAGRLPSPNSIEWKSATVAQLNVASSSGPRAVSPADARRGRSPGALFGVDARARRESPHRAMLLRARTPPRGERHGAPGSRRHRRYANEQFLLKGKELYDEEELKALVNTVDRTVASPWMYGASHSDKECEQLWEQFCNASEEEQTRLLAQGEVASRRPDPTRMDRRTRTLLRDHEKTEFGRHVFARIGAFAANNEVKLVLTMPSDAQTSMHRKVCHALARYYGLKSTTKLGSDDSTPTTIVVRKVVDGRSTGAHSRPPVAALLEGSQGRVACQ